MLRRWKLLLTIAAMTTVLLIAVAFLAYSDGAS